MQIQIKNQHLFFVLETIWDLLDYRFKYQINNLVQVNDQDDYVQTINIDVPTLMICYKAISEKGYGYTSIIAAELKESMIQQALANQNDQEYAQLLLAMQAAVESDNNIFAAKCHSGKAKILR